MKKTILSIMLIPILFAPSCGTLRTDGIVGDLIDIGAMAALSRYPGYADEIALVADLIRNNSELSDERITALIDGYLAEQIDDPALRALLSRLVLRIVTNSRGATQTRQLELQDR